jgi:hypothetical protein
VVICGAPHDTFQAAVAELTRLYRNEHPAGAMPAMTRRNLNTLA